MSVKLIWEPRANCPQKRLIVWLQRGFEDDHRFSSYIVVQKIDDEILESHHREFKRSQLIKFLCNIIVLCVGGGYTAQVIGVAGMHYPTQLSLFGITLVMTAARVRLRPMPQPLSTMKTHKDHEMDWLAVVQLREPDALEKRNDHYRAPTWTVHGGWRWPYFLKDKSNAREHSPEKPSALTNELMHLRLRIGEVCNWNCQATQRSNSTVRAIEIVANTLSKALMNGVSEIGWHIPVDAGNGKRTEYLPMSIVKNEHEGSWQLKHDSNAEFITSAISLWLFYDKETKSPVEPIERSIHFLGPRCIKDGLDNFWDPKSIGQFNRVRYVKKNENRKRETLDGKPENLMVKRNLIIGFQDRFKLPPPSFYYDAYRATVQPDVKALDCYEYFLVKLGTYSIATPDKQKDEESKDEDFVPAIVETVDLPTLYARHIFSAFLWAFSQKTCIDLFKCLKLAESDWGDKQEGIPQEDTTDRKQKDATPVTREDMTRLADHICVTGLCELQEEALLMMLPPLIYEKKREKSSGT
ncbi:uncharacterized protein Aud_001706 [Aspergillus udagawae]|uniref:Uncharacterized protein n=1 Tax=Aspergillus udagawae TaxID=91492 RepID=A0A8E0QMS3_9EURO|nr:uncharacterized protein Aud_001706 [Aspergillus udagawae]GIC85866.1 hypothetical protein Aud_001706 [Aspergillus udagawae]